jgi:hypothetical protein
VKIKQKFNLDAKLRLFYQNYLYNKLLLHNYEKRNLMFKLIIIYHNSGLIYQNPKPNTLMNCNKLSYATKHNKIQNQLFD